jgi:hypothetical protein
VTKNNRSTSPETSFTSISIPQLHAALNGRVIAPDDAGYDEARTVVYGAPPAIGVGPSVTSPRSVPSEEWRAKCERCAGRLARVERR